MATTLQLFTDGSFQFARPSPGFGWVAIDENGVSVAQGHGRVKNDGSNNFAGEAAAALSALQFAVERGVTRVALFTDLDTLEKHIHGKVPCRRAVARQLRAFVEAHRHVHVEVTKISSSHPFLTAAHHLARAAIAC